MTNTRIVADGYDIIYLSAENEYHVVPKDAPLRDELGNNFLGWFMPDLEWWYNPGKPRIPIEDVDELRRTIKEAKKMSDEMTEEQFLMKIGWEGGVLDTLEYGLEASDLEDPSSELGELWKNLEEAWKKFQPALYAVEKYVLDNEDAS